MTAIDAALLRAALAEVDAELRATYPALFAQVDEIKARPNRSPQKMQSFERGRRTW